MSETPGEYRVGRPDDCIFSLVETNQTHKLDVPTTGAELAIDTSYITHSEVSGVNKATINGVEFVPADVLYKILNCFGHMEGTWYDDNWVDYGITPKQKAMIEAEYQKRFPGKWPGQ